MVLSVISGVLTRLSVSEFARGHEAAPVAVGYPGDRDIDIHKHSLMGAASGSVEAVSPGFEKQRVVSEVFAKRSRQRKALHRIVTRRRDAGYPALHLVEFPERVSAEDVRENENFKALQDTAHAAGRHIEVTENEALPGEVRKPGSLPSLVLAIDSIC